MVLHHKMSQTSGGSRISRWGGGADPLGGANLRCVHFLVKTYAKTKEMDPVGGRTGGAPPDPPMQTVKIKVNRHTNIYLLMKLFKINQFIFIFSCISALLLLN